MNHCLFVISKRGKKIYSGAKNLICRVGNFLKKGCKKTFTSENLQRSLPVVLMIVFCVANVMAQSAAGGFASATTTIKGYQTQVANLMKAIGAVIAIVGAFNVYFKMQNGDQDVKKTIMLTIGGCIAFVALGEALPLFFE